MSDNWTFVCASGELLPGELKTVWDEVTDAPIVVFNLDGALYALAEDRLAAAAADSDLRERAETNTRAMLTGLARSLGVEEVEVAFAERVD